MGLVARAPASRETSATTDQDEQPAREQSPREEQPRIGAPAGRRDVPLTSVVVEEPKELGPVTPETGVADVLLGSIALIAAILVAGLVLGLAGGALRVYILHTLGFGGPDVDEADHIRLAIGRVTSDKRTTLPPRPADTSSPRAESQSHPSSTASQASTPSDGRLLG